MGGSKGGRDMEKWHRDVAEMGLSCFEVATSFLRSRHEWQWGRSRPGFWYRDLEIPLWAETMSRHEIDVAT